MNHDVTVSTTLCCRVLTLVCCLSVHAVPGFLGTWLPNTPIRHAVAQHLNMAQLCPTRVPVMLLYILSDLAGRASYRLWFYTSIIYPIRWLHVMHYRHFLLRVHDLLTVSIYHHRYPLHSMLINMTSSSMHIVTLWTWVYWQTCWFGLIPVPLHVYLDSPLFGSTRCYVMTLQYYMITF